MRYKSVAVLVTLVRKISAQLLKTVQDASLPCLCESVEIGTDPVTEISAAGSRLGSWFDATRESRTDRAALAISTCTSVRHTASAHHVH